VHCTFLPAKLHILCFIQVSRAGRDTNYMKVLPPCRTHIFIAVACVLTAISH
jgi:hypothetical protein